MGEDTPKEEMGPQHTEGLPNNYDTLIESRKKAGRSLLPVEPINPIRKSVAQMCIDIAWRFLVVHELIHILHGHVGYLQKTRSLQLILEITQSRQPTNLSNDDLDFQTIELWADSIACSVVLCGLLKQSHGPHLEEIFPKPEQRISLWSFAMFTLFRILGYMD